MNRTALFPVGFLALCALPLATTVPGLQVLLLVPLVLTVWVLRTGLDITGEGLTVRALVGSRHVPWAEVAGIRVGPKGDLWLVRTAGTELRLPVVRARDLPRLADASGGRIQLSAQ
ncbi:PH domain-containing protein [Blastococcus sp. TF02A-35]|nr:PH domain-containing protein [Blastococcus sp. TF02A_35]